MGTISQHEILGSVCGKLALSWQHTQRKSWLHIQDSVCRSTVPVHLVDPVNRMLEADHISRWTRLLNQNSLQPLLLGILLACFAP